MNLGKDKETLGIILGILVAIFVAAFQAVSWERLLPLLAVVIFALIFLSIFSNFEDRITKELQNRLPQISYIETRTEVDLAMEKLVVQASRFLIATGGKSRNIKYLQEIEKRTKKDQIKYWRILYDSEVTSELYNHLSEVIESPNTAIVKVEDNSYGNITLTDSGIIIRLVVN